MREREKERERMYVHITLIYVALTVLDTYSAGYGKEI